MVNESRNETLEESGGRKGLLTSSVIVPTFNNKSTIVQCVESLVFQDSSPNEIIIVDDGSTDGTSDLARAITNRFRNVRHFRIDHSGPSHARNVGISESTGDTVLFADADAIYSRDYLTKGLELLGRNPRMGAVCVTGTIWIQKSTFVSRGIGLEFEMKQRFLETGKWKPYFAFLYARRAIEEVGVFDERLFQGEDKDLFHRVKDAGYEIGLVRGFNWFHLYPQDVRMLVSRSYRGGKQRVVYVVKRRMYGELVKRTVGLWAILTLILISPFFSWSLPLLVAVLVSAYAYKLFLDLTRGWQKSNFADLFLLPALSAIRYLSIAVGYSKGSLVYVLRRMRRLSTGWADV